MNCQPTYLNQNMMEVENRLSERFDGLVDELPDELNERRVKNGVILEESEEEVEAMEGGGVEGEEMLKSDGLHHNSGRIIKKAKRPIKATSFSEPSAPGVAPTQGLVNLNRASKNLRRPRNSLGRGLPKKGGAGGKGTWGKLGDEMELPWVDPNDPNYDSDGEEAAEVGKKTIKLNTLVPEMSEEDVRKAVEPLMLEYFENGECEEVLFSLEEMLLNIGSRRWMVPALAIELSMDHKPSHREMTSQLISELYQKVISQRDIGKAYDFLLRQLSDLILDTPDASTIIGNFMARNIADDCIPPKFLQSYKGHVTEVEAVKALCRADTLLSMKHGLVRLDNVWGVGGGIRPVKYLVKKIVLLLKEYLCSCDIQEATRCLKDLEVPHFHHELVYEAVVMVIESMHEKTDEAMCKLLQALFRSFVITIEQMRAGFQRVYDQMVDISIDVPQAYSVLERWVLRCRQAGIINDDILKKMPSRGRKRFVSEGDGGLIKDSSYW
eukprot:GFUD01137092.1.p1 GENE.GFUD01137092.1~~GFUD01137092.1.p1  ORF type:complete len:495 (+),score=137.49 GFUD01137092.1:152-1636(+)